ncbi:MAG: hypothetical protein JO340_09215 [Acidobacteriaceae bacterium]|nr:hypothetical protein [Acidobacteriaceae bacterium]
MNRAALFVQAARGPILLITIGALFAIHQAGILSFSRTWPLIIITIGVMKLVERMVARPAYPPIPGPPMSGPPRYGGPVR